MTILSITEAMMAKRTVAIIALLSFALGVGVVFAVQWGDMATPTPARAHRKVEMSTNVHGSHPKLVWTAGGLRNPPPALAYPIGWINARFLDTDWTLFLDREDLNRLIRRVQAGVCPDVCDDEGKPLDNPR